MTTSPRRADPRYATPQEARAFAAGLPDQYLACRRYGHRFNAQSEVREVRGVMYATEHCACGSRREYAVSKATGRFVEDYRIHYAAGYLSDVGRISGDARGMLIVEQLTRGAAQTRARRQAERRGNVRAIS